MLLAQNFLYIFWISIVHAFIAPIEVDGRRFIDSVTKQQFFIKGIDYQPGGSAGYYGRADPLSDPDICARDIFLFQQLGINAIRVYTVNPDLNHDACMSMLAASGIYLILDVNSPKVGESLNRWEPWTTYTPEYLHHIFKVVHQFSAYNNTLAFFAGNEIVNDDRSASNSPHYIKAVIRDIKSYISNHAPRPIPVGYSAADDLRYRISLADFLACGDNLTTVDFYGVNSYQWCGDQTFTTSGYDTLVSNYKNYPLPIFLSEFGCNVVLPRKFQEIEALYGPEMTSVFSGGLVYEYSQEPNNYGLVEINPNGDVYMLKDFETLSSQFKAVQDVVGAPQKRIQRSQSCEELYPNINSRETIPDSMAVSLIEQGLQIPTGKFIDISMNSTTHRIFDSTEKLIENKTLVFKFLSSPSKAIREDKKGGKKPKLRGLGVKSTNATEDKRDDDHDNESGAISLQFMWTVMAILISIVCLHHLA